MTDLSPYLHLAGAPAGVFWRDANGLQPGDPGYNPATDSNNTDNGDGTFTDGQGNVMDSGGGLISPGPGSGDNGGVPTLPTSGNGGDSTGQFPGSAGDNAGTGGATVDPVTGNIVDSNGNIVGNASGGGGGGSSGGGGGGGSSGGGGGGGGGGGVIGGGGSSGGGGRVDLSGIQSMLQQLLSGARMSDAQFNAALQAAIATNQQSFDEQVREFNANHDLALQQFGLSQAGVTGTYNGQPTLAAAVEQANLTGWYTPPNPTLTSNATTTPGNPGSGQGTGGATGANGTSGGFSQQQYITARTAQLQQQGMSAQQAQQTAAAEWSSGNAQSGNVAYGLPPGLTSSAATTGGTAAATGPTEQQYITARVTQLQSMGMTAQQAAQTAQSEWAQGLAQSGNVAGGLPQGISFSAPSAPAAGTTGASGAPAQSGPPTSTPIQTLAGARQQAELTGMYNGAPTEAARQFNVNTQTDLAKLAASLQGPADYFKYLTALNQGRNIVGSLTGGSPMPAYGAPVGNTGGAQSVQNILTNLGVGSSNGKLMNGATGSDMMPTGGNVGTIGGAQSNTGAPDLSGLPHPSQINPAQWDSYGATGQAFLKGLYSAAGWDPNDVEAQINATRPAATGAQATAAGMSQSGATQYAGAGSQSAFQ